MAAMSGSPPALRQEVSVAPSLINITGATGAQRVYAISQGNLSTPGFAWGTCANPSAVTVTGEADAIEAATDTISARLPLGVCPCTVSPRRMGTACLCCLNRGKRHVTVINSQLN